MNTGPVHREPRPVVLEKAAGHVAAAIGSVTLAAAREFVDGAAGRPSLRQLEAHLACHPDALTSGASDAPVPVQRLAASLAAAGHPHVVLPCCVRCGKPKLLRHIVDDGRACDSCHRRCAPCSHCGKYRPIHACDDQQQPLCGSCTPRKVEPCGSCGRELRVVTRSADGAALCPNCYRTPARVCCRCGHTEQTYAHTDDGPVCKDCYERPKRRCGTCGDIRRIDRRAHGGEPDLCRRCRTRRTRSCRVCGTVHPANPRARHPVCLSCREAGHILEPDLTEPPDRTRRRRNETAHDALRHKLHGLLAHPEHGIADQLTPLTEVFTNVENPANVRTWLQARKGGAGLLHELAMRAHDEPVTHELLDSYRQGYGLHRLRALFVHAGILPERTELLDRIEPWLEQLLAQRPQHHTQLVRPFATWHALRRARQRARRRPLTPQAATHIRTQVILSLDFLAWLDERGTTLATANQSDLDAWLTQGSQTRYFLAPFISWAAGRDLCDLTVPHKPRPAPAGLIDDDQRWSMLRRCLHEPALPLEVRAAGVLVLLFGRTTTSLAQLTVADIHQTEGETYLWLGEFTVLLPPAAASIFHALRDATTRKETFHRTDPHTRYLFPGRTPGQPAAAHVLARKLRAHGIHTLASRDSARAAWARDIPAPIAAELLDIDISTATRWASLTRRDWTDYIAARTRAQDRGSTPAQQ